MIRKLETEVDEITRKIATLRYLIYTNKYSKQHNELVRTQIFFMNEQIEILKLRIYELRGE